MYRSSGQYISIEVPSTCQNTEYMTSLLNKLWYHSRACIIIVSIDKHLKFPFSFVYHCLSLHYRLIEKFVDILPLEWRKFSFFNDSAGVLESIHIYVFELQRAIGSLKIIFEMYFPSSNSWVIFKTLYERVQFISKFPPRRYFFGLIFKIL